LWINSYNDSVLTEATLLSRHLLGWRFKTIAEWHLIQTEVDVSVIVLVAVGACRADLEWSEALTTSLVAN